MSKQLTIKLRQIPMKDLFAIKEATGRSLLAEINAGKVNLDEQMVSALAWVVKRRDKPELTFDEVFSTLHLGEYVIDLESNGANPPSAAGSTIRKRSRP